MSASDGRGSRDERGTAVVPPTAVRLLPVLVVTFGLSMLIDLTTDWHFMLRWVLALSGGLLAQVLVLRFWASRRR